MRLHINLLVAGVCAVTAGCVSRHDTTAFVQVPAASGVTGSANGALTLPLKKMTVSAGGSLQLDGVFDINPDCSAHGTPDVRVTQQPVHGTVKITQTTAFPSYRPPNPRAACNTKRVPVVTIVYTPESDFIGTDIATFELIAEGSDRISTVEITVK